MHRCAVGALVVRARGRAGALALLLAGVGGCGASSPPPAKDAIAAPVVVPPPHASPAAAEAPEPACVPFGFGVLYGAAAQRNGRSIAPSFDLAHAAASGAYDTAISAAEEGDYGGAARSFLACAAHYREIPADHPLRGTAAKNAEICYGNAIYAFAMAGQLEDRGRAALEAAAAEDPALAPVVRARLAKAPHDCPVHRARR